MAVLQPNQKTPAHGQRCSVKLLGSAHRTLVPPHQGGGAKRRGVATGHHCSVLSKKLLIAPTPSRLTPPAPWRGGTRAHA